MSELAEACLDLKRRLVYSPLDARSLSLNAVASIAKSGQLILNLLDSWTIGDEVVRQCIPQLLGIYPVTAEGVQFAGDILGKTHKLALVVLSQFQIENLLRNLARELDLPTKKGFYRTAEDILDRCSLPADRIHILNTPARIRNSLHSNGIHNLQHPNEPPSVDVNGVTYDFVDGERVECASWAHIAHALETSVAVLEDILSTSIAREIVDPMMDQYTWDIETAPPGAT